MGRQSEWKVEYANAVYHVTARGNKRKTIYRDKTDRRRFRETLEEAVERSLWEDPARGRSAVAMPEDCEFEALLSVAPTAFERRRAKI